MSNQTDTTQAAIELLTREADYKVLKRVPEILPTVANGESTFKAAIIDLETTGLNSDSDEIIEIGTLILSFTNNSGFTGVVFEDNQLQQPNQPISAEITALTGITNEDVEGKSVDWNVIANALESVNLIICHNASFDRAFMEKQTPSHFSDVIKNKAFGCTARDVNWRMLGYEGAKLEYLNLKMGFFYDGHRALVDCWATLNILIQEPPAFEQLKAAVRKKQTLICAVSADFDKKDLLKARGYRWSDGSRGLPKCWHITVDEEDLDAEIEYLHQDIYGRTVSLPQQKITAFSRYSGREFTLS